MKTLYSVLTFCVAPWFVMSFGFLLLCSHVSECFSNMHARAVTAV